MHELSLCLRLVDVVLDQLADIGPPQPQLVRTHLVVGRLRQVVPEQMQWAYDVVTEGTAAEGSTLEVSVAPVTGWCRHCGWYGTLSPRGIACAACHSSDLAIEGGRELYVKELEVETHDTDAPHSGLP